MPIYEYECKSCKKIKEVLQRITDEPLTTCPDCSGTLKKLLSVSAFHLKGGGWSADGYKSIANGKNGSSCGAAPCASVANDKSEPAGKEAAAGTVKEAKACVQKDSSAACSSCPSSSGS